jgi:hypothetical protein
VGDRLDCRRLLAWSSRTVTRRIVLVQGHLGTAGVNDPGILKYIVLDLLNFRYDGQL